MAYWYFTAKLPNYHTIKLFPALPVFLVIPRIAAAFRVFLISTSCEFRMNKFAHTFQITGGAKFLASFFFLIYAEKFHQKYMVLYLRGE